MKKYLFIAASALALASCSSEDFVGTEGGNVENGSQAAINFSGKSNAITRANRNHTESASDLNSNFVLVGFKGSKTDAANETYAFDHYNVNYVASTAGSTTSNTADWEYVGQDMIVRGTEPAASLAQSGATKQTIKYWDHSCASYDFLAFSMGSGANGKYATPSSVDKTKLGTAAYTLKGDVDVLKTCFISDMKTVLEKDYNNKAVQLNFRHATSKVRMALFETVPGYVVNDVKFYSSTNTTSDAATTTPGLTGTFNKKGTMTVSFPTTGTKNDSSSDYNKAHVSFNAEETSKDLTFTKVNYTNIAEDAMTETNTYLGQTRNNASYCGSENNTKDYITVLPAEDNGGVINLKIDYTLTSTDGTKETIHVTGATAKIPAEYTNWKPGYAYTYIFKISQDTNGSTGGSSTGLTAISFDAVVLDDESTNTQETITTVSDPSITTYGFKDGKVTTDGDEYVSGTVIYATAFVPETTKTTETGITKVPATTKAPQALFTVTIQEGAAQTINEASIAYALTKKTDQTDGNIWTITDANKKKMTITKVTTGTENVVTSVPTEDGHNLNIKALKWTGAANTIYAVKYSYKDKNNNDKKAYKIVTVK